MADVLSQSHPNEDELARSGFSTTTSPANSPVLRPTGAHRSSSSKSGHQGRSSPSGFSLRSSAYTRSPLLYSQPEESLPDTLDGDFDLDFFGTDVKEVLDSLTDGEDEDKQGGEEGEGEDDVDDDEADGEYGGEAVHCEGVPKSGIRLEARQHTSPEFASTVVNLLRDNFFLPGWTFLPRDLDAAKTISIHKVSGSLTNAVFFISCPTLPPQPPSSASYVTVTAKPTEPVTVLLRIYGPSSGQLISRRAELHILHTLSSHYGIGPRILGTFENGRVEEYFESKALDKALMRDVKISRWVGRRMRELHGVDLGRMMIGDGEGAKGRPYRTNSVSSIVSASSSYSNTSVLSTSSASSSSSINTILPLSPSLSTTSSYGGPPGSYMRQSRSISPGSTESPPIRKKRSRSSLRGSNPPSPVIRPSNTGIVPRKKKSGSSSTVKKEKETIAAWENIRRWTKEAKRVFGLVSTVEKLASFSSSSSTDGLDLFKTPRSQWPDPLSSPEALVRVKNVLDLARFEEETKRYKSWVKKMEKINGKSKRVFAHNDAQYGNLLVKVADAEPSLTVPHESLIVIDFEYSGVNPRGFDIANHFIEYQADYHHDTLSWSLLDHGSFPSLSERRRFYRAYVGCDEGYDGSDREASLSPRLRPGLGSRRNTDELVLLNREKDISSKRTGAGFERSDTIRPGELPSRGIGGIGHSIGGKIGSVFAPLTPAKLMNKLALTGGAESGGRVANPTERPNGNHNPPAPAPAPIPTLPLPTAQDEPVKKPQTDQSDVTPPAPPRPASEKRESKTEDVRVLRLEDEVRVWTAASHAMWAVWAIVQSRDDVEARIKRWEQIDKGETESEDAIEIEFDYLRYALCRIELFRRELVNLGV